MKNSLLILGITLVSFTTICNAKSIASASVSSFQKAAFDDEKEGVFLTEGAIIGKPTVDENEEVFNPETVIPFSSKTTKEAIAEGDKIIENPVSDDLDFMLYEEAMKEIIAQSDLIIENSISNETYPLFNERTIENEIATLETIIESKETNETVPLDFNKINCNGILNNTLNSKKNIGMK